MNFKSLLILILILTWSVFCWRYYTCNIKGFCPTEEAPVAQFKPEGPILFYKNTDSPYFNRFSIYRDSICKLADSNRLDVVGYYYSDETNTTGYENLGIARAMKLRSLLLGCLSDSSKISTHSHRIDTAHRDSIRSSTIVNLSAPMINTKSTEFQIVTSYGKTDIYFPSGSAKEIKSKVLDSFLMNIAQSASGKKIYLKGHTDNVGVEEANVKLSFDRAAEIKKILEGLGVSAANIISEGKGSSMPKVDNSTPDNRALNRRVELVVE